MNLAGLSWLTILKKKENFRRAFEDFDLDCVAIYGEKERQRLLADSGIIRNHLKVDATIENVRRRIKIREQYDRFAGWIDLPPLPKEYWVKLFKQTFRFTGGETTGEFLMSAGYLPGAHHKGGPIYKQVD